jgi:hypothetical protein
MQIVKIIHTRDNIYIYIFSGRGFALDIGFIGHFSTQLVITLNYSAIDDFHTLQVFSVPQCLHE